MLVESDVQQVSPKSSISFQLGWDLLSAKARAYDLHHNDTHQVMIYVWGHCCSGRNQDWNVSWGLGKEVNIKIMSWFMGIVVFWSRSPCPKQPSFPSCDFPHYPWELYVSVFSRMKMLKGEHRIELLCKKKKNSAVDVFVSKTLCLLLYDKFVFHVMQFYSDEYANIELTERSQCEVDAAGEGMSQTPFLYAKHSVWSG